jgi:ATP-dependent DNA ligase
MPTPAGMGVEGIVSKRLGSRYRSGRSPDWLKFKNWMRRL